LTCSERERKRRKWRNQEERINEMGKKNKRKRIKEGRR
jgi:hypothetical protein